MAENKKILVYRKKWKMNIGILLFGIIFIYLIAMIFSYATKDKVTSYEVHMGSILNDENYTGMAIREEKVVSAEKDGYVNYYSMENKKIKAGAGVCGISPEKLSFQKSDSDTNTGSETELTDEQQNSLGLTVQAFTDNFTESMFAEVYSFKDSVRNALSDFSSPDGENVLDTMLNGQPGSSLLYSTDDGVIAYETDGFETFTEEQVTLENFNREKYYAKELHNNMKVAVGEPIYKLITSEEWSVVVPITEKTAEELKDRTNITVRFLKDNETMVGNLSIKKQGEQYMAYIGFSGGMIRYADERFLDLELIITDYTGLKIPKSSIVKKPFFVVPTEYVIQGGNSDEKGVLRRGKDNQNTTEFVPLDIYYTKDNLAYFDLTELNKGDILIKPDSNITYVVGEQKKLTGVYQINKGYAVFKQIQILCESKEYYIVQAKNKFGLTNYDHIALDSSKIKENDIITQ